MNQADLEYFMAAAKVLHIEGLNEHKEPVHELKHEATQDSAGNSEANFESANENYEAITETSMEEVPSQFCELEENIYRNYDGKYSCDACDYQAKQKCHLKSHILGKHEGTR